MLLLKIIQTDSGSSTTQGKLMFELLRNWQNRYLSNPQFIILGFLLALGFILIWLFGKMLAPFFAAIVISYLLEEIVSWLERLKIPRKISVIQVFLLFVACLLFLLIWLLPLLSSQIGQLLQDLPTMISSGQKELMQLPEHYPEIISPQQVDALITFLASELTTFAQQALTLSMKSVRGIITFIVYLILVPLMVFFFLKDKIKIIKWAKDFLPENRGLATRVWKEVNQQVGNYIRGKIWEILIVWGISYATFIFIGLRYTMLLSLFVGLSVLIPYVGATVMFFPVALIAFFQWGLGNDLTYTLIAYGIIQALDGNLLVPLLLSEVVNLHPVAIIVAILIFGGLWGMWGLFFAIPLATLIQAVIKAWGDTHSEDNGSVAQ
jgi:putative permease